MNTAGRPTTWVEAMFEAFPDNRNLIEWMFRLPPRLTWSGTVDQMGRLTSVRFDGYPSSTRQAFHILRDYYDITEGFEEPSDRGWFRTSRTWELAGAKAVAK